MTTAYFVVTTFNGKPKRVWISSDSSPSNSGTGWEHHVMFSCQVHGLSMAQEYETPSFGIACSQIQCLLKRFHHDTQEIEYHIKSLNKPKKRRRQEDVDDENNQDSDVVIVQKGIHKFSFQWFLTQ